MIVKLSILIAFSLLLLVPTGYSFADDKEDKKEKKIKTLESECGKKLDIKKLNFDGLMCQAVFELQSKVDTFVVDITINWADIVGIPEDIADGDDDTHLTEAEVDAFVSNNGFSTEPHTVDTDTLYSGVDFATSNQNCAVGNVVTGIDENGIITCVLDETGTSTDTSELQNQVNTLQNQFDTVRCSVLLENAVLNGCDLSYADLSGINLNGADFTDANLRFTILTDADLEGAIFIGADLTNTGFNGANLKGADFRNQDLTKTILSNAALNSANLNGADLTGADLTKTSLNSADLIGADLTNARLSGNLNAAKFINANLSGANLSGATLFEIFTFVEGAYADPPCTGHSVCSTIPTSP
jgi:uncharacterized protein YjbI with pentapeptide repeats